MQRTGFRREEGKCIWRGRRSKKKKKIEKIEERRIVAWTVENAGVWKILEVEIMCAVSYAIVELDKVTKGTWNELMHQIFYEGILEFSLLQPLW